MALQPTATKRALRGAIEPSLKREPMTRHDTSLTAVHRQRSLAKKVGVVLRVENPKVHINGG